jgi:hypothetical protein
MLTLGTLGSPTAREYGINFLSDEGGYTPAYYDQLQFIGFFGFVGVYVLQILMNRTIKSFRD